MKNVCHSVFYFIAFTLMSMYVQAQQVSREAAMSAYIYNFAKNVEWQNETVISDFHFLIIGQDQKIINELNNLAKTKTLRGKPITVSSATTFKPGVACQLIFVTNDSEEMLVDIFDKIEGKNILLVSDEYKDENLIMVDFYTSKDGTLLFKINRSNILNQNITIMPDMVLTGGTEVDVAALYHEGQESLRSLQKRAENLENNLNKLQQEVIERNEEVQMGRDSLRRQSKQIQEQQLVLEHQQSQLCKQTAELQNQKLQIVEQNNTFKLQSKDLENQRASLEEGAQLLKEQEQELEKQKTHIAAQKKVLKEQGSKIHNQRKILYLLLIIILLVFAVVALIYFAYRNKQKHNRELEMRVEERTRELHLLNLTLEDKVTERTAQLVAINKELESFSYSISHDLRAPLRAIFGFSQILSRRHTNSLNEEGKQYMNYIVEASIRMEQLINDLLNYSRLGRKSIDLHPVSLYKIAEKLKTDFKQRIEEVGGVLRTDSSFPEVKGDESLLMQIFNNLIENAITYRRTDVMLQIDISCTTSDNFATVTVADNGIGIPREYWEKIFNIFQRLHSEDQYPGTGIGLATVQKAVAMINGTISVDSVVGEGSRFIIELPLCKN